MRIAVGSDHAGFALKEWARAYLADAGHQVEDFGCHDEQSVDYPDIARPLAEAVAGGRFDLGLLVCSNGIGMSITATKVARIRAALCHDTFDARRAREHTNANVLCLGGWCTGPGVAGEILDAFFAAEFQGGRHQRRIDKMHALEQEVQRAATGEHA